MEKNIKPMVIQMDLEMKNGKEGVHSKDIKINVKKKDMENINFLIKINKRFMGKQSIKWKIQSIKWKIYRIEYLFLAIFSG